MVWDPRGGDASRPGTRWIPGLMVAGLLLVVDLGFELPVALAVGAGRVNRVDRDDLLGGVTVGVKGDGADNRVVAVGRIRAGDADRFLQRGLVGRVGRRGAADRVEDDLGA